jgi:hypothetical protein
MYTVQFYPDKLHADSAAMMIDQISREGMETARQNRA